MTDNRPSQNACIVHRRSIAAEGYWVLARSAVVLTVLGVVFWYVLRGPLREEKLLQAATLLLFVVVIIGMIWFSVKNIRRGGMFECRIDDKEFVCTSPVRECGDSFCLPISEIAKLEREDGGSHGGDRWYVWNTADQRFHITYNYGNPGDKFIAAIRQRIPDIPEIES